MGFVEIEMIDLNSNCLIRNQYVSINSFDSGHNILEFYNVLVQVRLTTSKTKSKAL